nr:MAG TPA: hypothetical protein [Caudoviricetes sp.]
MIESQRPQLSLCLRHLPWEYWESVHKSYMI